MVTGDSYELFLNEEIASKLSELSADVRTHNDFVKKVELEAFKIVFRIVLIKS